MKYTYSVLIGCLLLWSCSQKPKMERYTYSGAAFGTSYSIIIETTKAPHIEASLDSLYASVNQSMSTYDTQSDISKINRGEEGVRVDFMFEDVFNLSMEIHDKTQGYFDPTVGALVNAWGFGPGKLIPLDAHKVDSLMRYVGFGKLVLKENHTIYKPYSETFLDFNAIAKGYAIDRIGVLLDRLGYENYLIEVGGELLAKGRNVIKDKDWVVGIDDPQAMDREHPVKLIFLKDRAMASSGNYRKFRIDPVTGEKYVHTLNPLTGYTQNSNVLAVSVLADNCAKADGYATSFMAMGLEKTKELVSREPSLEVFVVYLDDQGTIQTYTSTGFEVLSIQN